MPIRFVFIVNPASFFLSFGAFQVKVWFQNRRMKWRHSRDTKTDKARSAKARPTDNASDNGDPAHSECSTDDETSCSSDEANSDIDVVAE